MARKRTPTLTDAELRLMQIIWEKGEATVNDVLDALPEDQTLAYNSVLTIMRILETKGYLGHRKEGRAHVYLPLVTEKQARKKAVRHMVSNFFNNSPELLLLSLVENDEITPEEIEKLKEMIKSEGEN